MTSAEVIRTNAGRHIGYMPQSIWDHRTTPICWEGARRLLKIPGKLTAYFKRELITEARKAKHGDHVGTYYLQLVDGTYLEVEY